MILRRILPSGNVIHLDYSGNKTREVSEGFTFNIVLQGKYLIKWANKEQWLYQDSFMVLAPGTVYQSEIEPLSDLAQILTITLMPDFVANISEKVKRAGELPTPGILPFRGDLRFNIVNFVRRISNQNCTDGLISYYLEHILINYYELYHEEFLGRLRRLSFAKDHTKIQIFERLTAARSYILHNYNKRFTITELAIYSCLSVNHLIRTFKQAFGISPYQYLTLVRLNRARIYLESGNYSINETVIMVGFESVSSFIKLFKATFHTTPLKFRKRTAVQQEKNMSNGYR